METNHGKENLNINKKKRKRPLFNSQDNDNKKKINPLYKSQDDDNTDSVQKSQFKRIKLAMEEIDSDNKKNDKANMLQVVKCKSDYEKVMEDYVVEEEKEKQPKAKKKISQKKIAKLEKVKERKERSLPAKDPSAEERTIFVGNVNINTDREKVKKFFTKYGEVEAVRFRGITPESLNMTKKEAVAKKLFNPHRKSLHAYVRFKHAVCVEKALEANGSIFEDLHIHVDKAMALTHKDKNSVFVGNLPWEVNEEDLWEFFAACGKITNVRIIRSSLTGAGKGFGFVSFESNDGVEMALHFDGKILMNRKLRVKKIVKKVKDISKLSATARKRHGIQKRKNVMDVSFLKRDKPQIRVKNVKEKSRRKSRKSDVIAKSGDFSGSKAVKGGHILKKVKRKRNQTEKKKLTLAKKLGCT